MADRPRRAAGVGRRALGAVVGPGSLLWRTVPGPVRDSVRTVRRRLPTPVAGWLDAAGPNQGQASPSSGVALRDRRPAPPAQPRRLWVGPVNFAGQGHAWGQAVERYISGCGARSMAVVGPLRFPVDYEVTRHSYRSIRWQREQQRYVEQNYTHVLIEAERPLYGTLYGGTCERELPRLRRAGVEAALICHGSDVRLPSRHAARFPFSPFTDPTDGYTKRLERQAVRNLAIVAQADAPVFVSTPDLLDDVPQATWCPGIVDVDLWAADTPVLEREVPRVVHVPSNGPLKGSELVDPVMAELHAQGLIDYRTLRGLDRDGIRREYQQADIVLDQFVLGLYGVAAIEAMAAGRVVVAFVTDRVRRRVTGATGRDVPIVEADPLSVRDVVTHLVTAREEARSIAGQGPAFVREVHDGRYSARVLARMFTRDVG